ncbi:ferritin family protein [Candidatus Bipolaricaulota bacterium]
MNDELKKALEFAIEKEREAEAFYKEWAAKVESPAVVALFAELAGVEHGHVEMLLRITPEEIVASHRAETSDLNLSDLLVGVEASKNMGVQEAMILAMKREESAAALYESLSGLGGVAQSLFEALAKEERKHKLKLETEYDEQILTEN